MSAQLQVSDGFRSSIGGRSSSMFDYYVCRPANHWSPDDPPGGVHCWPFADLHHLHLQSAYTPESRTAMNAGAGRLDEGLISFPAAHQLVIAEA